MGCYFIQGDWGKPIRGQQTETRRNTVVSCSEGGWGSPSSRRNSDAKPQQQACAGRVGSWVAEGWSRESKGQSRR